MIKGREAVFFFFFFFYRVGWREREKKKRKMVGRSTPKVTTFTVIIVLGDASDSHPRDNNPHSLLLFWQIIISTAHETNSHFSQNKDIIRAK